MTNILAIIVDAAKDYSYSWLIAASLPPVLYFLTRKRKQSWLRKLMMKWVMKRAAKLVRKGKKLSDGAAVLLFILAILGIGALLWWLLGWTWAVVLILLFFLILGTKKGQDLDF